jgi:tetratricopeptide (TPR) repeat protein
MRAFTLESPWADKMKRLIVIAFLFLLPSAHATKGFKIRENGKEVELVTPWGTHPIVGDLAPNGLPHYRIEIPLDKIKPAPNSDLEASKGAEEWDEWEEEEVVSGDDHAPASTPPRMVVEYDDSDRYVVEANRLFNRKKYYEATTVVEELLRKKPDHVRGWIMKGSLMRVQGHKDLAKNAYEQALKLEPNNQEIQALVKNYKK